ncbi:MAG TPA: hypothetical protein VFB20_14550 [Burkholderiales bacterium]|nr:hypothetical protein [Burkholderiales bacterium]
MRAARRFTPLGTGSRPTQTESSSAAKRSVRPGQVTLLVGTRKGAFIYRSDAARRKWQLDGPHFLGNIVNHFVLDPRDPDCVWIFPTDGTEVWPRTSPAGRPAAYRSVDGGASWQRQDQGLPREHAWWTVKRQAFCADGCEPVGLYFGTTGGEIWASVDEGASWFQIAAHLPHVYSVTAAEEA